MASKPVVLLAGALLAARPALAQCPDGSPPPCARGADALSERTWVVMPFANVTGAREIDWLRDASVNLLYLHMSRWDDVRVIDDERVADALRLLPADGQRRSAGLQTGMSLARRLRAGRLVMGDLLNTAGRTSVVAKIYDVRTGRRERSVELQIPAPDSVVPAYASLARAILGAGGRGGPDVVGTSSLGAYRSYMEGTAALNRWDLATAIRIFERAIRQDSQFALAYYKLARAVSWLPWDSTRQPRMLQVAEAAGRYGAGLPARERTLIAAMIDQAQRRYFEACTRYASLIANDSTDAEAWYNLGECNYHDDRIVRAADSSLHFRSSFNLALHAFQTALRLDPGFHLAFGHVGDILTSSSRWGCLVERGNDCQQMQSQMIRSADTLVYRPVPADLQGEWRDEHTQARNRNIDLLRLYAGTWAANAPGEPKARLEFAKALAQGPSPQYPQAAGEFEAARRLGAAFSVGDHSTFARMLVEARQPAAGVREFRLAASREPGFSRWLRRELVGALLLADSFSAAAATADSLLADTVESGLAYNVVAITFARCSKLVPDTTTWSAPDGIAEIICRLGAGFPHPEMRAIVTRIRSAHPESVTARFLAAVDRFAVGTGAALLNVTDDAPYPLALITRAVASNDTALLREALKQHDSLLQRLETTAPRWVGFPVMMNVEGHLLLGDRKGALAMLVRLEAALLTGFDLSSTPVNLEFLPSVLGRLWLRTGDLAMEAGQRDLARRAYRRLVALWSGGDAFVQPTVARAREALARLDGRRRR